MMKAWFTFLVWAGYKRGRITCLFKGHVWRTEIICGYPGLVERPLSKRCHQCARLEAITKWDNPTREQHAGAK